MDMVLLDSGIQQHRKDHFTCKIGSEKNEEAPRGVRAAQGARLTECFRGFRAKEIVPRRRWKMHEPTGARVRAVTACITALPA
jgi:hypothetical protein